MCAGAGPHRTEPQARRAGEAQHLPAVLSLIAGMADVTSWLTLGGLFSAHITGNLVIMAADLVRGGSPSAAQVLAVPVFVASVALAGQVARICGAAEHRCVRLLLLAQFALLACAFGVSASHHGPYGTHGWLDIAVGMSAVAAMGVQNALLHLTRRSAPTTAVMTGNVVVATLSLTALLAGGSLEGRQRWHATWPLLAGFLGGCVLGAVSVRMAGTLAWLLPAAVSLAALLARPSGAPDAGAATAWPPRLPAEKLGADTPAAGPGHNPSTRLESRARPRGLNLTS